MNVGLYRLETMQRLDVADSVDDQISLGKIEVGRENQDRSVVTGECCDLGT